MEELYGAVRESAYSYLCWRVGPECAPDRLHDTFVAVVEAIQAGAIREPERIMGFVRTVLRYQARAEIRVRRRLRREQSEEKDELLDRRPTPEHAHLEMERRELMRSNLRSLGERDREILQRFYLDDQSQQIICAEMHLTKTQYRLLKSRAKARFSELALRGTRLAKRSPHPR